MSQPKTEAIHHFYLFAPETIQWRENGTLDIKILSPNHSQQRSHRQVEETEKHLNTLAQGEPLTLSRQLIKGKLHFVCSGPAAAKIALSLRDKAELNFPGADKIPT